MTQEELSVYIRVSSHAVSRWENGMTYPDIFLLPILADIFEVDVDKLLDVYKKNNVLPVYQPKTKQNINSGICPRCGGTPVERTVQYCKFIVCSNYPNCKFILKNKTS